VRRSIEILTAFLLAACIVWAAVTIRRAMVSAATAPFVLSLSCTSPGINATTGLPNPGPYLLTAKPVNGVAPYGCLVTGAVFPLALAVDPTSGKFSGAVQALPLSPTGPTSITVACNDSSAPPQTATLIVTLQMK